MSLVACPLVGSHTVWFLNASSCHGFLVIRRNVFTYCLLVSSFSPSCYLVTYCGNAHFYRASMRVLCLALFSFTWSICSLRMPAAAGSVHSLSSGVCFALMTVGFYNFSMYECICIYLLDCLPLLPNFLEILWHHVWTLMNFKNHFMFPLWTPSTNLFFLFLFSCLVRLAWSGQSGSICSGYCTLIYLS